MRTAGLQRQIPDGITFLFRIIGVGLSLLESLSLLACNEPEVPATTPADTSSVDSAAVQIPAASEWTDHGIILSEEPGTWEARYGGMTTPCDVVRKNGTYYLYYLAASGDRESDGGPADRALGVATSDDPTNTESWTKYAGNPVLTHQPHAPDGMNVEEEGIFAAATYLESDGTVVLYYGGMEATSESGVDSDIMLATSSNGLDFTEQGDVLTQQEASDAGGDEIYPGGAWKDPAGTMHLYYYEGHTANSLSMHYATAPDLSDFTDHGRVLTAGGYNSPMHLKSDTELIVPRFNADRNVDWYTPLRSDPGSPGPVEQTDTWDSDTYFMMAIYLDRANDRWLLFYNQQDNAIGLKSAPVSSP